MGMQDYRSTRPDRSGSLLGDGDPSPVIVINPEGRSPFLLIGDHAGNAIPFALGTLGLCDADLTRHIAWDIGVADLGDALAARLDAVFIHQTYSRLVIDCNRATGRGDAVPVESDGTRIPGNDTLTGEQRAGRVSEIHEAYHKAIEVEIARRVAAAQVTILVSLHSFTPVMDGSERPWQIGVLYAGGDEHFAKAVLESLSRYGDLIVGDNEPYLMDDTDHTVPRHAFRAGIPYVELEVAQSELQRKDGTASWCDRLDKALSDALASKPIWTPTQIHRGFD
jgi:predicted N-formylglutamate amidohydrolase